MRRIIINQTDFIVTGFVQRDEMGIHVPADPDQNSPPVGARAVLSEDLLVLIGAPQLGVGQLGLVDPESRVDRADGLVQLPAGDFQRVVAGRFVVAVAQTADRYLLVDAQRDDPGSALKNRLDNVVVLVDQMGRILWRTLQQIESTA